MTLVNEQQKILRKIVDQRHWRAAGGAIGYHAGIVFDSAAIPQLLDHFNVIIGALANTLCLDQLVVVLEKLLSLVAFFPDPLNCSVQLFPGGNIVAGRVDRCVAQIPDRNAAHHVYLADSVDLIAEKLDSDRPVVGIGREDFNCVTAHTEHVSFKSNVVSLIADLNKPPHQFTHIPALSGPKRNRHVGKVVRFAQTVDTADGGNHDHVPPLKQRAGGADPQPVDLLVCRGVLLNIGIGVGNIGLRLIIVVIAYKILHRVFRKELLEFAAQLCRQCFIVRQDKRWAVHPGDNIRHREGLA